MRDPLQPPKRILFAGDWHADISWATRVIWNAGDLNVDLILHAGDFGYTFHPTFIARLDQACTLAGVPIMFVDGNHDNHTWLGSLRVGKNGLRRLTDWIWHVPRGFRWTWAGIHFLGLGGAHSVDGSFRRQGGLPWWPQERISHAQAALIREEGPADVLLSHDCPAGVPIPGLNPNDFPFLEVAAADDHRRLLRKVVDTVQPRLVWHGHYHVPYQATVDLGWGPMTTYGLDQGGDINTNTHLVELDALAEQVAMLKAGKI